MADFPIMRRLLAIVVVAFFLLVGVASGQTYRLHLPTCNTSRCSMAPRASAVCIGKLGNNWIFLSAGHAFNGDNRRAMIDVGDDRPAHARLLHSVFQAGMDISILTVEHGGDLWCASVAERSPPVGTTGTLKGFPHGGRSNVREVQVIPVSQVGPQPGFDVSRYRLATNGGAVGGDSGGGLFVNEALVGITSRASPPANQRQTSHTYPLMQYGCGRRGGGDIPSVLLTDAQTIRQYVTEKLGRMPDCGRRSPGGGPPAAPAPPPDKPTPPPPSPGVPPPDAQAAFQQLQGRVEALEQRQPIPGPVGPPGTPGRDGIGKPGRDGLQGERGPAGISPEELVVFQTRIAKLETSYTLLAQAVKAGQVGADDLAQIQAALKALQATKIPVQSILADGTVVDSETYSLGDTIVLRYQTDATLAKSIEQLRKQLETLTGRKISVVFADGTTKQILDKREYTGTPDDPLVIFRVPQK